MSPAISETFSVPRLCRPDPDEFRRRFEAPRLPVVITGEMDGWQAMRRWSPDFFAGILGNLEVKAITTEAAMDEHPPTPEELIRTRVEKIRLRDFLREVAAGPVRRYVSGMAMRPSLAMLLGDFEAPVYREENAAVSPRLWLGRLVGPLHYDQVNNLHGVVYGAKRFTLFHPDDLRNLYPCSLFSYLPTFSRVSLGEADYERFPRLRKARAVVVDLGPGDLLFLPAGWWHQVTTPELTISIDFPWTRMPRRGWPFLRLALWKALTPLRGRLGASR